MPRIAAQYCQGNWGLRFDPKCTIGTYFGEPISLEPLDCLLFFVQTVDDLSADDRVRYLHLV